MNESTFNHPNTRFVPYIPFVVFGALIAIWAACRLSGTPYPMSQHAVEFVAIGGGILIFIGFREWMRRHYNPLDPRFLTQFGVWALVVALALTGFGIFLAFSPLMP
ncbi:MAG TPA: hypothetical protein PK609_01260 [Candidatus Paceibacterota bacterium]|nr:hypothetical protein [Candidatus Paceibacterota bacterium]